MLAATLGLWEGSFERVSGAWVRLWNAAGNLVPSPPELAAAAEARASDAEARAARFAERLKALGVDPEV